MAVFHAFVFLVPVGHEFFPLILCGIWHDKYYRRRGIIIKEPLLEFRSILVNLYLVCDAFGYAKPAHERVERIELLHNEHIFDWNGHRKTTS